VLHIAVLQRSNATPNIAVKWVTILLRIWLPISAGRSVVLIEGSRYFPQFPQANAGIEHHIINSVASEHFTQFWILGFDSCP
jgi:hypothetical protein